MKRLNTVLNWSVKVTGVIVTAPVTATLAGQAFGDVPAPFRLMVQGAAVLLVEGVFLSSWVALEADRTAPLAYKVRYALTALGLYMGLLVLALAHGEGISGWVFRLALLAALLGSIYDSGVYTALSSVRAGERDVTRAWRVRRVARRLAQDDALLDLRLRSAEVQARRRVEHEAELQRVEVYRKRLLAEARASHPLEAPNPEGFPYPIREAQARRAAQQKLSAGVAKRALLSLIADNPDLTKKELARAVGRTRNTVAHYLEELHREGKLAVSPARRCGYEVARVDGRGS